MNKISHIINCYLVGIMIVVIAILSISKIIMTNYYVDYKINDVNQYFIENPNLTVQNKFFYLVSKGFYVTSDFEELQLQSDYHLMQDGNIMPNTQMQQNSHKTKNSYIEIKDTNDKTVAYGAMNIHILDDLNTFLSSLLIVCILITIAQFFAISRFLNAKISRRLDLLPDAIKQKQHLELYQNGDEISLLYATISENQELINQIRDDDKQLIKALSHELKSPIMNLEAILKMHQQQFEGYTNYDLIFEKCMLQTKKLNLDIVNLVTLFDIRLDQELSEIDLVTFINHKLRENHLLSFKQVKIDFAINQSLQITANLEFVAVVINNIISNIAKYCLSGSTIDIQVAQNTLLLINSYEEIIFESSNYQGNEITKLFGNKIGLDIDFSQTDTQFYTKITKRG